MITLHESDITTFPMDNGIGVLRDVIRAYAEEELNGLFEFYMEYDSEGHLVDELKEERIIKAKAQDKLGYQLFRIYSITKNHENDNLIVRAQHITYDLANNFVESLVANNLTKKQVMELIGSSTAYPHPFNVTSSNTTTISSTSLYRTNPLQMIGGMDGSVLQIWGGQIERDNFNLILHDRRGSDDGVKVTYEKNITGLEATFDISGLVTRIFPFVYIEATDNEPARLITVRGKYIDSPHINDYEKIYIRPIDYTHDERINLDGTDTQIRQQLTNIANSYFTETGNDKIKVDMEVQFEHLWETEEYKDLAVLELVGMGDTVTIEHSRLKVDATAIVNYIRYDCIAEKNEEVRLGSVKARLTDNVNRVVDVAEKVEQAQQTANQAIKTANGKNTIFYGPDEPTNGIEGDLWFRVVDGEYTRTYRHDGIQWQLVLSVDVRDAIDEAQQAKDEAQSAVNRANQATQQATNAINQAQTAFDEAQNALGTASNAYDIATTMQGDVTNLSTLVDEHTGQISSITQSVTGLQTQVSDIEGNVSTLTQTVSSLTTRIGDAEGNITTLQQTSQSLATRISDNEGNISTLTQTVQGLQTRVTDAEGNISNLTQLSTTLQSRISDAEGNISTLTQTASSLQSTVSSLQSEIDNIDIHILQGGGKQFENLAARSYGTSNVVGALVIKTPITYTYMTRVEIVGYNYQSGANDIDLTVSFYAYTNNTFYHYSYKSVGIRKINKVRLARENGKAVIIIEDVNSTWSYPKIIIKSALIGHGNPPDSYKDGWDIAFETNLSQYTNVINVSGADVQSQITQLSDAINLRVQKGDVINQINISDESILIDGKRIHITGQTTIDDASIDGAAIKNASIGNAQIGTIDAAKITSGELNTNNITIRGGNATEYTYIQGAYLESRGKFTRTWRGTTKTHDIALRLQNGYLRARNDTEDHSLYFSDMGISTYADGSGDGLASGTLAFRDTQYSTALGVTLHSHYGVVALESAQNRVVIAPQTSSRQGTNHFSFRVKNNSWEYSDGWISFGDISTNTYHSGLRFSKYSGLYTIYATNGNGDIDSGYFRAKGFIGELLPTGSYNYVRAERTRFVQPGTSTTNYADIQFRHALANTIRVNDAGANFYIGTSTGEVRITTNELSRGSYRPIRASSFNEASSRDYKTNIEKYTKSALAVINDLTVVTYNLKDDLVNGINDKKVGFISEDSPAIATADGKAIQTYQLSAYNTKAIQELDSKFTNLEDKVNWLEIENQYLKQKIKQLEEMIA